MTGVSSQTLSERDFGDDAMLRHACLSAVRVVRPAFRQMELIGNRQARLAGGNRQTDRDLAVVVLAELAAILPRNPTECLPLGKPVSSTIQARIGP